MSESTAEISRWREKYLTQIEASETREKLHQTHTQLLQRLLVRISLVAEGQDEELDTELSGLRVLLRKTPPNIGEFSNKLKRVDTLVRCLDERYKASSNSETELLKLLIDQLISLDLSRKNKKALQCLSKKLKGQGNDSSQYPLLMKEYAQLQSLALSELLADEQKGNESSGIMSRLFGSKETDTSQELPSATKTNQVTQRPALEGSRDSESVVDNIVNQKIAGSSENLSKGKPTESINLEPVCTVLTGLLDQLGLPDEFRNRAQQFREKFDQKPSLKEFNVAVDGLATLIIEAAGKSQQDFENFLQSLEGRLVEINRYLVQNQKTEKERLSNSIEIDQKVRANTESISEQVQSATDIDVLKTSVQQHIDNITSSMDGYIATEKHREQLMHTQMEALQEKLALVENESKAVKNRLQVERVRALTDVLTRVPNREALNERFRLEWDRFQRYKKPISLAILDIDHFKMINDKYGHLVGDRALQLVADTIKNSTRKTDFVARFGGEEFVVLMPETQTDRAGIAMNNLRETIANMECSFLDEEEHMTISIGIVGFRLGSTRENLFEYADQALYKAKEGGRNRVEIF